MEFESTNSNTTAKLPILKLTQENGTLVMKMFVPVTAEEKTNKKNDVKPRSLLLLALPNEHQLTFSQYPDAKTMFAAIETRFGGNEATKKTQKTLLKQQSKNFSASSTESLDSIFNRLQKIVSRLAILGVVISQEDLNSKILSSLPPEWNTHVVVWMNKPEIETMSIDDLSSSTNHVNTAMPAYEVSTTSPDVNTANPQVSTDSFSDNAVYSFMVENPNGYNLLQQDLEHIHEADLEAMDLKWQLSLLSMRAKRYYQREGKKIFINANDTTGYDKSKSDMAEEQVQTNMALMAFLDSKVSTDKTCYKTCLKNYETLKKQCDDLIVKLNQTEFTAATYKRGLVTAEEQLITYRKNEVLFSEEVAVLKREVACKDYEINVLKSEFEKVKQEKEGIEFKIEKFDKASKDLDKLPKKLDLSYSGLDEFKEPEFKGYGTENSEQESNVVCDKKSDDSKENSNNSLVEYVKPKNHEKPVKKSVRYAEMYRSQTPRGNQRNWNGQKSNQLGSDFVMYNKACFIYGSFNHLQAQCKYHQRERIVYGSNYNRVNYNYTTKRTHPNAQRNMVPRAVLMKTGLKFFNTARTVNTAHPKSTGFSDKPMSCFPNTAQSIGKPQQDDIGFVDSGCSRHMTGNIAYLSDFKEFDGGYVTFGGGAHGGRIFGKGTLKTDSLDCEDATSDESMLWHRRLGHINFKNLNKLVKDNLVRGLPTKSFENDQTCVAYLKGKQHKASCNSKVYMGFLLTSKDETSEILKNFIKEIENLVDKKVKIIRSDNRTEFKNKVMDDFCREKCIKREYSIAKTPQQNGVAERGNRTLIEAARIMLADFKLPTIFWAEAVSTACYVHNRVLVVKPHNKTPYELFRGFKHALSFMRPFGCHVTIFNTLDSLGKFDGKSDEENKPMIEGNGPKWLFDIDSLTQSMNYVPVAAGIIINESAGTQEELNAGTSEEISQDCIVMPIWKDASYFDSPTQDVDNGEPKSAADDQKQDGDGPDNENDEQDKSDDVSSPKEVNAAGQHVNTASPDVNTGSFKLNTVDPSVNTASSYDQDSPKDMFTIGASHTLEATHVEFFSDEDEPEVDLGNITNSYTVPTTPNTRIHKDHPIENVIGDVKSSVQTRRMTKPTSKQGFLSAVWILVDLPIKKRAIGTKWVFRNKKDERGIVIRNKARLVAQGFLVYQMDMKSAFLYGNLEEEVYVLNHPGFKDPDHPDKVYKVVKAVYGLHQAPRACQDKYVAEILKKFNYTDVKSALTPVDLEKPLVKDGDADDVDVHLYRSMIGSLMYLTHLGQIYVGNLLTKGFDARRHVKRGQDTKIPQSSGPPVKVGDEAVHKELGDRMERAATTASSLEAEQDSGSGPRCQDTILGDVDAQTRFETTSKQSNDPPLSRGYTLGSGEDRMKLLELMELYTQLSNKNKNE
ncbi:putative reverse transcriptase domain-containing protein [Tanacetum coccineum]|uniref:Reverse transcriptase domain-containing protein n=1 Tax=Tanacetum coccineum TaxID=301880 RepID=A0ABQ5CSC5_9ASTR